MGFEQLQVAANRLHGYLKLHRRAGDCNATLGAGASQEITPALVTSRRIRSAHMPGLWRGHLIILAQFEVAGPPADHRGSWLVDGGRVVGGAVLNERELRESGVSHAILRPAVVFGPRTSITSPGSCGAFRSSPRPETGVTGCSRSSSTIWLRSPSSTDPGETIPRSMRLVTPSEAWEDDPSWIP
jgi:hypothetical protein